MADPWLTIIGLCEDGPQGLSAASREALENAEIVMGAERHLDLIGPLGARTIVWPKPFAEGIPRLLGLSGRRVAMLASGDPFWFGAGRTLARHLPQGAWRALPGPSTFSLAAARLGWAIEETACFGLHAAPLSRLRPTLAPGAEAIVLLRDGAAVGDLARYLVAEGFGATQMTVMEALGGPREAVTRHRADSAAPRAYAHPVAAALCVAGDGPALPLSPGRRETWFEHDGQITRSPVRALTLAALAPCAGEHLWDIGSGSGSIAIEWLLSHPGLCATGIERDPARAARIRANADRLGVDRLRVVEGSAPDALSGLPPAQAIFVGGGLSSALLSRLEADAAPGTRLVANAVTLETEALLAGAQARRGGTLTRIALSEAAPLGPKRGWRAQFPIVQWSVTL